MSDIVHEALSCDTVSVSVISFSHSRSRGWAPLTSPASAKISCLWLRLHAPCHFNDEENKYIDVETLEISFSMGPGLCYMAVVWVLQWWVTMLTRTRKLFLPFFWSFLLLFLFVSFFYPFISFFFPSCLDLLAPVEHNSVYTYPGPCVPDICVCVCVWVCLPYIWVCTCVRACVPRQTKLNQSLHQNSCSHASGTHDKKYGDPNQQQSINNDFVQIRVSPVWGSRQQGVDWETPRSWSASIGSVFIAHTFY